MTTRESIQLAWLWTTLADVQAKINNELVPVAVHLGIKEPDLLVALDTLSTSIKAHLDRHMLQAVPRNY